MLFEVDFLIPPPHILWWVFWGQFWVCPWFSCWANSPILGVRWYRYIFGGCVAFWGWVLPCEFRCWRSRKLPGGRCTCWVVWDRWFRWGVIRRSCCNFCIHLWAWGCFRRSSVPRSLLLGLSRTIFTYRRMHILVFRTTSRTSWGRGCGWSPGCTTDSVGNFSVCRLASRFCRKTTRVWVRALWAIFIVFLLWVW